MINVKSGCVLLKGFLCLHPDQHMTSPVSVSSFASLRVETVAVLYSSEHSVRLRKEIDHIFLFFQRFRLAQI